MYVYSLINTFLRSERAMMLFSLGLVTPYTACSFCHIKQLPGLVGFVSFQCQIENKSIQILSPEGIHILKDLKLIDT